MPDREDASKHAEQPSKSEAALDRSPAEAQDHELAARNDAVLPRGQLGHRCVTWPIQFIHSTGWVGQVAHPAEGGTAKRARGCASVEGV